MARSSRVAQIFFGSMSLGRNCRGIPIQRAIMENYYLVPVFRHAFMNAIGPRIAAQKWQDVFPTITTGYAYPWEDIRLKE